MTTDLLLVTDFDGTLVDTEKAVRRAYEGALGKAFRDEVWGRIWGQPWHLWTTYEVKRLKDQYYPQCLREHASLTPFGKTMDWNRFLVLTGASRWSVNAAADHFFRNTTVNVTGLSYGCPTDVKNSLLRALRPEGDGRSFYFDDNLELGLQAVKDTGFTLCHVDGENIAVHEKKGRIAWTQLYSLLEPMNVCGVSYLPTTSRSS